MFNLIGIKNPWLRRPAMIVVIPPCIVFALIVEPVWAGIKMLVELVESFAELPHSIQSIWRGKRCRYKKVGWFTFAGDPY